MSLRKTNISLESAAGDEIKVEGIGSYRIRSRPNVVMELRNCFYAPSLVANFLSAGKLNEAGMDIFLRRDGKCIVSDDDGVVVTGRLTNGMYKMDLNSGPKHSMAAQFKKRRSLFDWHKALGHLNVSDLRVVLKEFNIATDDKEFECKYCLLAKMTRQPHPPRQIESTRPLELIHTDLSGIIRTFSTGGFRYYLTFIDDFSRYATVYLLKSKEEVYMKFDHFKRFVENKFERKIKRLRSDNGTEYINENFEKLVSDSGIDHERTQINTAQQNGVAERFNRTIGNGVRSALIESGLPSKY